MKRPSDIIPAAMSAIAGIALFAATLQAQTPSGGTPAANTSVRLREPTDVLRKCTNPELLKLNSTDSPVLQNTSSMGSDGNNPQEVEYWREIRRLLLIEIQNVKTAMGEVEKKHLALITLYPQLSRYHEIIIEDVPGAWGDGVFVNSKIILSLHYDDKQQMNCLVLDSMIRSVYNPDQYTRKLIRLYAQNVQALELETRRHNFRLMENLTNTAPEIQIKAMRLVYQNLRTALYSMDMMIAGYYQFKLKQNEWQINL